MVYNLLFAATAETLRTIAADPKHLGAEIGFFAVLHTWGQNLIHHPHLHCVVPGGGLSADGQRWMACRAGFFLPVRVLSRFFRRRFLELLSSAFDRGELEFFSPCRSCVSARPSDAISIPCERRSGSSMPKHPLPDPSRSSTTSAAIPIASPSRTIASWTSTTGHVTFRWKDYRDDNAQKTMTLEADEFIRRFLLHVLPQGLQRIRYYGLLGNRHREEKLAQCRQLLKMEPKTPSRPTPSRSDYRDRYQALTGISLHQCPVCHAVACSSSSRSTGRRSHRSPSIPHEVYSLRPIIPAKLRIAVFRGTALPDTAHSTSSDPLTSVRRTQTRYLIATERPRHLPTIRSRGNPIIVEVQEAGINPHSVELGRRFSPIHF